MRGVYPWPNKTCIRTQVVADHRLAGNERTTMRSASIGPRTVPTDCPVIPAEAGRDDQIVLFGTVSINRAIGDAHALGADTSGLRQYTVEIAADNGECAEPGKLRLLPAEPLVLLGEVCIKRARCGIAVGAAIQYRKTPWESREALRVLMICSTMRNARMTSSERYGLTISASPSVLVRDICPTWPEA